MTKRVHIAVGLASATGASLLFPEILPDSIESYCAGLFIAAAGAVLPDIDISTQSKTKSFFKNLFFVTAAILILLIAQGAVNGTLGQLLNNILKSQTAVCCLAFIAVCFIGYKSPHRTFTHWFIGAIAFSAPLYFLIGEKLTAWFFIAFLSHQIADMLNKKRITWLFPIPVNFSRCLCRADGFGNLIIGCIASILTPIFIIFTIS